MRKPLFCIWNNESIELKENQRRLGIQNLNLLSEKIIPIFDEATQTAANCLNIPVCCLGVLFGEEYQLKSAYGLSNLGLMNDLAKTRKIHRDDTFATHVIDSNQYLVIENTLDDPFFAQNILTQHYGIISYLGVPLTILNGVCVGCLEVIDTNPRKFTSQDINFLMITARWCIAEYERNQLAIMKKNVSQVLNDCSNINENATSSFSVFSATNNLKDSEKYVRQLSFQLLNKLTQLDEHHRGESISDVFRSLVFPIICECLTK